MLRNACFFALFAVAGLMFGAGGAFAHSNHHHAHAQAGIQYQAPATVPIAEAEPRAGIAAAAESRRPALDAPADPAYPWHHCPECGACCGASGGAALSHFAMLFYPERVREQRIFVPARIGAWQTTDDLARPPKSFV